MEQIDLDNIILDVNSFIKCLRKIFLEDNKLVYPKGLFRIKKWPKVLIPETNRPPKLSKYYIEYENLDVENIHFVKFDGEFLEIICYGDWQLPQRIVISRVGKHLQVVYNDDIGDESIPLIKKQQFIKYLQ